MIDTEVAARRLAEAFLDEQVRPLVGEDLVVTLVREFPTCWIIGYNTQVFVETGAMSHALAGGGPIIVNRASGSVRMGTSALPSEQQVDP